MRPFPSSTPPATAPPLPGKQYVPASGTLTFLPGQAYSEQTFPVTILPNLSQSRGDDDGQPDAEPAGRRGDAGHDQHGDADHRRGSRRWPRLAPADSDQRQSPSVTSEQVISSGQAITAIVLGFNKPLVPERRRTWRTLVTSYTQPVPMASSAQPARAIWH